MTKQRYAFILFLSTLFLIITTGFTMGLLDFSKVCLYSEVSGVVTLNGKPVAGAEVIRKAWWPDKLHTDSTTTDAQGKFHFEPMFAASLVRQFMPAEPYIRQQMYINYQNKEHLSWDGSKRGYELNDEFWDKKLHPLICELSDQPAIKGEKFGLVTPVETICKW